MAWHGRSRRSALRVHRRSRGAALLEYALVLVLVVIGSIGAIDALEDDASDEVDNQATCLEERPPPAACQQAPNTPLGVGGGGVGGDPGGGDPAPTQSVNYGPGALTTTRGADPRFDVDLTFTLLDDSFPLPLPLEGEVVTAQVVITGSSVPGRVNEFFYVTCASGSLGVCTFAFDSQYDDVTSMTLQIVSVGADTPYDIGSTTPIAITQPPPNSSVTLPII